ncbi:hypothetical protein [Sphingobacterium griseoflavum]|uniref:Uncharacterized protein n=1 Tax=Sphingobacterium griseoflavum TaxID=1474952 RepID=A0ABQ3HVR4_9SPHI|nr:hypothetical protein [Sphingobacterium griseoflavum]GHE38397.1 hypothetical protein GCM10017764_22220 [Sphingobacterium griseoflavum]
MKYKIGDLVRFVDEPIEGHITSFQQNEIVGVTDESGFEIPVLISKITLVHGNMRRADDDESPRSSSASNQRFVERGIYLGVDGEQRDGLAKFFIINHSSFELLVSIGERSGNKTTGLFAEKISSQDFIQFYTANFSSMGKWPNFDIQILRHSTQANLSTEPISKAFRVKPLDLIQSKEHDPIMEAKVWRFELDKPEENIGVDKLKDHFISHRPNRR